MQALIDGHYFRTQTGTIGSIDAAKTEAIGNYLFDAGILNDGNGSPLATRPDLSRYFSNAELGPE
jgi:hypothetical protein